MTVRARILRVVVHFLMLFGHGSDGMLVTTKAGVAGSGAWMTGHTGGNRVVPMREREGMRERSGLPRGGGVAVLAIYSSLAGVRIVSSGMAGVAGFGRA